MGGRTAGAGNIRCGACRDSGPGGGADARRRGEPGDRRLHGARHTQGGGAGGGTRDSADRHPGRPRHGDAQDHQGDPCVPGAGCGICGARRRARRQRRHLHSLCQPYRGDGAGDQPRRRDAGGDRHHARRGSGQERAARTKAGRREHDRQAGRQSEDGSGTPKHHDAETDSRCGRLHPQPGPTARPQRRMGRARRAQCGEPVGG